MSRRARVHHAWLERAGPGVAWSLLGATGVALAGAAFLGAANSAAGMGDWLAPLEFLWALAWLGFGMVGALLAQQRPRNPIGWILLGIPFAVYVSLLLTEYAVRGLVVAPGSLPLALAAGWISKWSFTPALALVLLLLLVFPTGRVGTRRMRHVAAAVVTLVGALTVLLAVEPMPIRGDLDIANPLAVTAFGETLVTVVHVVGHTVAGLALVVVGDVVRRWYRAHGIERQQFRWFASAAVLFPTLFVVAEAISQTVGSAWSWNPVVLAFFFGMNGLAAAIGVAVARYRLFEIDRLISRTVSYAVISGVLVGLYVTAVIGLGAIVRTVAGESGGDLIVAASTLLVAAAFGPVRRRVQAVVDRRFNRARYDAEQVVARFRERLRGEVELKDVVAATRSAAAGAVQPARASLWLRAEAPR